LRLERVTNSRTNAKFIKVLLDNAAGVLTDISAYVSSVGTVGLTYDTADVTAFSDGVKNVAIGQPGASLQFSGPVDTVIITQLTGYAANGGLTAGGGLSLDIRFGIRHAWEAGEPQFGITGSASVGYLLTGFTIDSGGMTWTATFGVLGATAPAFSTAAEA